MPAENPREEEFTGFAASVRNLLAASKSIFHQEKDKSQTDLVESSEYIPLFTSPKVLKPF